MAVTKRTISIPDEVSEQLDSAVPIQERSKFATNLLTQALKEKAGKS